MKLLKIVMFRYGILVFLVAVFAAKGIVAGERAFALKTDTPIVIGHLVTNQTLVSVISSGNGLIYSIRSENSETLSAGLTEKELFVRYPELKATLKKGMAINDASLFPPQPQSDLVSR